MQDTSDIAACVEYEVIIITNGKKAQIQGKINVLEHPSRSNLVSSSDWVQTVKVLECLIYDEEPVMSIKISSQ